MKNSRMRSDPDGLMDCVKLSIRLAVKNQVLKAAKASSLERADRLRGSADHQFFDILHRPTMTYPMLEPTTNHVIQYSIEIGDRSVHLRIWEPKAANKERLRPFLFAVNYFLESEDEAFQFLRRYLNQIGADATQVSHQTRRGELKIVPMPTEDMHISHWE